MALVNFTFTYKVSVRGIEWFGKFDSLILVILMLGVYSELNYV